MSGNAKPLRNDHLGFAGMIPGLGGSEIISSLICGKYKPSFGARYSFGPGTAKEVHAINVSTSGFRGNTTSDRKSSEPSKIPEDDHWKKRIGVIETKLAMRDQGKSKGHRRLL